MACRAKRILTRYEDAIADVFAKYGLDGGGARDRFERQVRRVFRRQVEFVLGKIAIEFLKSMYPRQADRAKFLDVDRTRMAHIERAVMPREYTGYVFDTFQGKIKRMPEGELTNLASTGTISYIRKDLLKDRRQIDDLTREELEFLFQMFVSDDWRAAEASGSVPRLERVYRALAQGIHGSPYVETCRILDYGQMEHVMRVWGEAFLLGVGVIPFTDGELDGGPGGGSCLVG
jgi:hypothetical protein